MRRSPVVFDTNPLQTRNHNGFQVVLDYDNESDKKESAPAIIDVSHMSKWDIQDMNLHQLKPMGHTIPEQPGACAHPDDSTWLFRLNETQACIWKIHTTQSPENSDTIPDEPAFTDITDAHALLAITGPSVPSFLEKITSLDLMSPHQKTPFILQGPILHIACRVLVVKLEKRNSILFFSFSRGYAQTMTEALLDSGSRQGVYFAGEQLLWSQF